MGQRKIATLLTLKDKISTPLVGVSKKVTKVSNDMKKAQKQVADWQKGMVKGIDKVVKAGLALGALGGAVAIKLGYDGLKQLDEGSAKVKSIAKDSLELKKIQKDLLKYSNKTGIAVNELSETQYNAISSGVKSTESIEASVTASKLAIAGFTDSTASLKTLTSTMNVYGLTGVKAMTDISDKMLVTQNLGVTTVAELSESLGDVTPIAKSAGMGIDDVLSSVATLTKGGMSTSKSITNMKGVISSIIKPTAEAQKTMKSFGIDMSVSAIKSKGFPKVMQELKEKTKGNTEIMGKLFGGVEALAGALALTSDTGMKDFINTLDEMKNSAGATDEAYKIMTNTIGFKTKKIGNTIKNTFTGLMNTQSGAIGEYLDKINNWFDKNQETLTKWVSSVGNGISKVVGVFESIFKFFKKFSFIIGPVLVFITTLWAVVKVIGILKPLIMGLNTVWLILNGTLVVTPLGWIVLGIAAVIAIGYALWKNWDKILEKIKQLGSSFSEFGGKYTSTFVESIKRVIAIVKDILKEIINSFKPVVETLKTIFGQIASVIKGLMPILIPIIGFIMTVFVIKMVYAFLVILNNIKAVFTTIAGIVNGILKVFSGVIDFVVGVFTLDWDRAWQGIKTIFSGIIDIIHSIWKGLVDLLTSPVDAIVNILDSVFKEKIKGIKELWSGLKNFLKHPIKGVVNLFKKEHQDVNVKNSKLKGYARGGIANKPSIFGEAGREIAIPLNKNKRSKELLRKANREIGLEGKTIVNNESKPNIVLQFNQPIYGFADFKNQVAKALVDIVDTEPNVI